MAGRMMGRLVMVASGGLGVRGRVFWLGLACDGGGVPFGRRGIFVWWGLGAFLDGCVFESMIGVSVGLDRKVYGM